MTAAERWTEALASWAIPPEILDAAPESPYGHQVGVFARRAEMLRSAPTPSRQAALEALPPHGSVLDVGCGAGASSLPLADVAATVIGVDPSREMLDAFSARMAEAGVTHTTLEGRWDEAAKRAPTADVVVCHHVAYNVPDLRAHLLALTAHARTRVILELTATHPLSWLNPLWLTFHGLERPTRPTADDAVAVLHEIGVEPHRAEWESNMHSRESTAFSDSNERVAWVRRRLCLPGERDDGIRNALERLAMPSAGDHLDLPARTIVSLWWKGGKG